MRAKPAEAALLVSIRAPRAGGDVEAEGADYPALLFQSAPPAREATIDGKGGTTWIEFQSAPPAREATAFEGTAWRSAVVSIRAPRAGGDSATRSRSKSALTFQSAPPAREATSPSPTSSATGTVSIRAPRAGGDPDSLFNCQTT